jgi:aminoglycoside N3'-acetyltransferase
MARTPAPVDAIAHDLAVLGVAAGDLLMVHTSMRRVGPVDGGAAGLVTALDRAVGPRGTVLVNIGVRDDWDWVNTRPEDERVALLRDAVPFDCLRAPADPDNGVFAEVFRTHPGTLVSDHPEGRLAARGALAADLTRDVPWDDYYGPGSPLDRFLDHGGRVLRLGADIETVTLIHFAEYLVQIENKRRVRRHRLVAAPGGPVIRVIECLDDSAGIVERPADADDDFGVILLEYLATGRALTGRVGGATSELIDGGDLVAHAVTWMARTYV